MTNADGEGGSPEAPPPPPLGYPAYASAKYPPASQASHAPSGPPPPGYPPPGYPPSGYPRPGYPPPGYPPPWYPPPGYPPPGHPPPGWQQYAGYPPPLPPALKPGVIPLRPLTLSDIFNGAVAYIRANPKATLGLTTIVVITTQIIALILQVGPLAATGGLAPLRGEQVSSSTLLGSSLSGLGSAIAIGLSAILLSGMLTVVVGRAVFGTGITIGEAWQRFRDRLLALIGLTALEALGALLLIGVVVLLIGAVGSAAGGGAAVALGIPLVLGLLAALVYLGTMLTFAPAGIVLERLPIVPSIRRSFALVRGSFWRVFGIRLLAAVVANVVATAVAIPLTVAAELLVLRAPSTSLVMLGTVLSALGSAIGQIITAPFTAGAVVLLYTDRRIRAEAFDLVLQTGAASAPGQPADSTDHLWLTRHP
jgi:hypothetical protein